MTFFLQILFSFSLVTSCNSSIFRVPRGDSLMLIAFFQVPQNHIVFLKEGSTYVGELEIDIKVEGKEKGELVNDYWKFREVRQTYEKTLESFYLNHQIVFKIPKDREYRVTLMLRDGKTGKELKKMKLKLSSLDGGVSDLIPLERDSFSRGKKVIIFPSLKEGPLFVYYEVCDRDINRVNYEVIREDSVYMKGERMARVGFDTLSVPFRNLPSGEYRLTLYFEGKEKKIERYIDFSITSFYRLSSKDYEMLIGALSYIAERGEVEKLKSASPDEREALWKEFWEKRDPTPGTPRNEYMEEYMRRVEYANEHFSIGKWPGYKTDRGMIYIKYGPPDDIEDHPYEWGSRPYVIWYYYSLDRYFVFVDKYGIGDYELVYPYDFPDFR